MPQSSIDSFKDDSEAEAVLETNFTIYMGHIVKDNPGYMPTQREAEAIQYLIEEWDFAYVH